MSFEWLFLVSVVAGLIGTLGGVGPGIVLIPVLTFFGIHIKQAIAISTLSVIAIANSASIGHVRRHTPNLRVSAFLEVFAVLGAFVGALSTLVLKKNILILLCGIVFLVFALFRWNQRNQNWKPVTEQDPLSQKLGWEGSYYDYAERRTVAYKGTHAAPAGILMFGSGFLTTLLGFGANAFNVLIDDMVIGLPPKVSVTMNNFIIGVIALAGVNVYLEAGLLNPDLVAPVIPGIVVGALIGSKVLTQSRNEVIQRIFLMILTGLGLVMIMKGLGCRR